MTLYIKKLADPKVGIPQLGRDPGPVLWGGELAGPLMRMNSEPNKALTCLNSEPRIKLSKASLGFRMPYVSLWTLSGWRESSLNCGQMKLPQT